MSISSAAGVFRDRLALALLGGLAGTALWALTEADALRDRAPGLFLVLLAGLGTWSGVALALAGPLRLGRAMAGALLLALPAAALLRLAGQREMIPTEVLDRPGLLAVFLLMIFIATPFLCVGLQRRGAALSYPDLFETAWAVTIRFAAALLFTGVVWGLLYLSDALLGIVGIGVIETILDIDGVPAAISGAAIGLGLAVIHELREVVSPLLLLRLLRLLVWPILAVVGVFLVAVPLQGLSGLVGQLSPAATLMGVALGAVTLITSAIGRDDADAVRADLGARLLALAVPLVAGLALWAVAMRVVQYGLTPERVLAGTVAAVLMLYGLAYALAVLRGRAGWMARLRRSNVGLALLTIAVCAAWLTPLLDAEALSARSQVARFADGRGTAEDVPLRPMLRDWGKAGEAGLRRLEAMSDHPQHDALSARIANVRRSGTVPTAVTIPEPDGIPAVAADLARWLPVRPEGRIEAADLERINAYWLGEWHARCAPGDEAPRGAGVRTDTAPGIGTVAGTAPDAAIGSLTDTSDTSDTTAPSATGADAEAGAMAPCVVLQGRFVSDLPADAQALIILPDASGGLVAQHVRWPDAQVAPLPRAQHLPNDAVRRILSGDYALEPTGTEALGLDGRRFGP